MTLRTKHHLNAAAVVLLLLVALLDPWVSFGLAIALLVAAGVWEWLELRRLARK